MLNIYAANRMSRQHRQSRPGGTPTEFGWNRGGLEILTENMQYL